MKDEMVVGEVDGYYIMMRWMMDGIDEWVKSERGKLDELANMSSMNGMFVIVGGECECE